jgi:hypothetical protein
MDSGIKIFLSQKVMIYLIYSYSVNQSFNKVKISLDFIITFIRFLYKVILLEIYQNIIDQSTVKVMIMLRYRYSVAVTSPSTTVTHRYGPLPTVTDRYRILPIFALQALPALH